MVCVSGEVAPYLYAPPEMHGPRKWPFIDFVLRLLYLCILVFYSF